MNPQCSAACVTGETQGEGTVAERRVAGIAELELDLGREQLCGAVLAADDGTNGIACRQGQWAGTACAHDDVSSRARHGDAAPKRAQNKLSGGRGALRATGTGTFLEEVGHSQPPDTARCANDADLLYGVLSDAEECLQRERHAQAAGARARRAGADARTARGQAAKLGHGRAPGRAQRRWRRKGVDCNICDHGGTCRQQGPSHHV
jgi:hypothetical protein